MLIAQITDENGQKVDSPLMTPREVANLFRVDPKTVTRWAKAGRLTSVRTLGGHRRYPKAEVVALLSQSTTDRIEDEQDTLSVA